MSADLVPGMEAAFCEAELALSEGEVPVGAALFQGGRLIWSDHNRKEQIPDPTAHAEMLCLRHAAEKLGTWRLNGCTLYVTMEPCPMCAGALLMSRADVCVFAASDPEKGCCGSVYDLPADPALHGRTAWIHAESYADRSRALLSACFRRNASMASEDPVLPSEPTE